MRIICSTQPSGRTQQVSQWSKTTVITPDWTAFCKWFLIPRFQGFGMGRNDQRLLVFKPPVARTGTFSQRHFLPHLPHRCESWVKPGWTEISLVQDFNAAVSQNRWQYQSNDAWRFFFVVVMAQQAKVEGKKKGRGWMSSKAESESQCVDFFTDQQP